MEPLLKHPLKQVAGLAERGKRLGVNSFNGNELQRITGRRKMRGDSFQQLGFDILQGGGGEDGCAPLMLADQISRRIPIDSLDAQGSSQEDDAIFGPPT
jgi:hypothetical protein